MSLSLHLLILILTSSGHYLPVHIASPVDWINIHDSIFHGSYIRDTILQIADNVELEHRPVKVLQQLLQFSTKEFRELGAALDQVLVFMTL